jgi:hypothetical protein
MNFPSWTGNEMLRVVRVAMCSLTSKRVTHYMHSFNSLPCNWQAPGLNPAQCSTNQFLVESMLSEVQLQLSVAIGNLQFAGFGRSPSLREGHTLSRGQLAARRSRLSASRRLRRYRCGCSYSPLFGREDKKRCACRVSMQTVVKPESTRAP